MAGAVVAGIVIVTRTRVPNDISSLGCQVVAKFIDEFANGELGAVRLCEFNSTQLCVDRQSRLNPTEDHECKQTGAYHLDCSMDARSA